VVVQFGWGEATDEPPPLCSGAPTPAREDQPSPGYGATGARPTEIANCTTTQSPQAQLSFEIDYNNEDKQNPKNDGNSQPQFFPVSSLPGNFFQLALHRLIGWLISSNHVSASCYLEVCRKNRLWLL
jgi:hypothetical protein